MQERFLRRWMLLVWICCFSVSGVSDANLESVLERLTERSRESHSDSVLVLHRDKIIFQYSYSSCWLPLDTMSITKAMASLAIGLLIDEGKITSIDTPVYHFYPEWDQGNKRLITLRHLLAHTSGLQADPSNEEIYQAQNVIQLALCAELVSMPGSCYSYNNKAINLISGIVKKASGCSLSEYLSIRLFCPLGIENVSWLSDRSGNEYAMSHLTMTAPDLAKIGQLIANKGMWHGKRIISHRWIEQMCRTSHSHEPFYGLSWWMDYHSIECHWDDPLLQEYLEAGVSQQFIKQLRSLQGRVVCVDGRTTTPRGHQIFSQEVLSLLGGTENADRFYQQVKASQLPFARWKVGSLKTIVAKGYQGQQLIIFPDRHIVAVRQSRAGKDGDPFQDFQALVEELSYRLMDTCL